MTSTVRVLNPILRPWEHRPIPKSPDDEDWSFPLTTVLFSAYQCFYYTFVVYRQRGLVPSKDLMIEVGAKYGPSIASGEGYRYILAYFVPCQFIHFVLTLTSQLMAGTHLETNWGTMRVAVILWVGELAGMLASCTFSHDTVTTGSTSAIMSILGACIVKVFSDWQTLPRFSWRRYATFWSGLVVMNMTLTVLEFNDPIAAAFAFLIGILTGLAVVPVRGFRTKTSTLLQLACIVIVLVLLTAVLKPC